ncbi:hypothetical protein EON65_36740 [archaeon]|nr:MAG: hypothetical protein EON65_36740 [archaeon]
MDSTIIATDIFLTTPPRGINRTVVSSCTYADDSSNCPVSVVADEKKETKRVQSFVSLASKMRIMPAM